MKRSHASKNIYRTREEMRAVREAVLEAWAAGDAGEDIAKRLWISRAYVDALLSRARKAGDPRAAHRYLSSDDRKQMLVRHHFRKHAAERHSLIRVMRATMSARSIATVLGVSKGTVYRALSVAG